MIRTPAQLIISFFNTAAPTVQKRRMTQVSFLALVLLSFLMLSGCQESPFDDYPESFTGRLVGTMHDLPFEAEFEVHYVQEIADRETETRRYEGTYTVPPEFGDMTGRDLTFNVDCVTEEISSSKMFGHYTYDIPLAGLPQLLSADIEGNLSPTGGSGTWDDDHGRSGSWGAY